MPKRHTRSKYHEPKTTEKPMLRQEGEAGEEEEEEQEKNEEEKTGETRGYLSMSDEDEERLQEDMGKAAVIAKAVL